MATQLKVVSVQVRDVLGAREFAMEPRKVTVISGRNGSGKSSALGAVKAALGGGSLAKLARVDDAGNEVEPEVVLVLEGGGEHYRVERDAKKVRVRRRVGDTAALEDVPQPQTWLNGLVDGALASPVRFLNATDKERAKLLLEALPLKYDRAACLAEIGITEEELAGYGAVPAGVLHPLEETALIRESVFRARTGVNRDQRQQVASAEQLKRKIPAAPPEDPSAQVEAIEAEIQELSEAGVRAKAEADAEQAKAIAAATAERDRVEERVAADFKVQAGKLRREHEARAAEIRAEAERRIAEDLAATNATVEGLREGGEAEIEQASRACEAAVAAAHEARAAVEAELQKLRDQVAERRESLATLKAQRDEAKAAGALLEQVETFEAEADRLGRESARLTRALELLDAHQRKLAEDLPIPGLSIEGSEIRVNGVPFEQLNTAQRTAIAIEVAKLRADGQRLPFIFLDDAEKFDPDAFEELVAQLRKVPGQYVLARVDRGDLSVESHEAPAEVVSLAEARQ